jgi:hypothetical protein
MSVQFSELAQAVSEDGRIEPQEILSLRQLGWGDGQVTQAEAEAIFAINDQITAPCGEWVDFFVEAIGEFVLNATEPRLMCSDSEAAWLMQMIDADGRLESMAELEALVRIVERARNVPDSLKNYALKQIEHAVLHGDGPTRNCAIKAPTSQQTPSLVKGHVCNGLDPSHISNAECAILRRLVFASGGHGPAVVSRFDAEMLFRIKDATLGASNALEWPVLFVDAVANYLCGFSAANAQLSHDRMLELESFIADTSGGPMRFFGRMAKEAPNVANHFGKVFGKKVAGGSFTERAIAGEQVTEAENTWLNAMIDADGEFDVLEIKLAERIGRDLAA